LARTDVQQGDFEDHCGTLGCERNRKSWLLMPSTRECRGPFKLRQADPKRGFSLVGAIWGSN
jgi:hypothetical protein